MLFLCSASKYIIYYTLSQRHKHMLIKTIIRSYCYVANIIATSTKFLLFYHLEQLSPKTYVSNLLNSTKTKLI